MMAEALLANKTISAIENLAHSPQQVHKSDDEVREAVIEVVGCFGVSAQWSAVYRVLADFCGWENDIKKFSQRMNALLKEVRLCYPCSYQSIQKPLSRNSILRKSFLEWKEYRPPKGDRVFPRQMFIARKLLKFLCICA